MPVRYTILFIQQNRSSTGVVRDWYIFEYGSGGRAEQPGGGGGVPGAGGPVQERCGGGEEKVRAICLREDFFRKASSSISIFSGQIGLVGSDPFSRVYRDADPILDPAVF